MYELKLEKSRFYRVKQGQTAATISRTFGCPVPKDVFCGQVLVLPEGDFFVYQARVGDTFASLAEKFSVPESTLREINGLIYPTCRLYIPRIR